MSPEQERGDNWGSGVGAYQVLDKLTGGFGSCQLLLPLAAPLLLPLLSLSLLQPLALDPPSGRLTCFVDPRLEFCRHSRTGVPYPRVPEFVRALLVTQLIADLADVVDGLNLGLKWGEDGINFDKLQADGTVFAQRRNARLASYDDIEHLHRLRVGRDLEKDWREVVNSEERRIELMKKGRYIARWRSKACPEDPRLRDQDHV